MATAVSLQKKSVSSSGHFESLMKNFVFHESDGRKTIIEPVTVGDIKTKRFINEFWTARQRQANPIHEISYRACFKPQLPGFFIEHLTKEGDYVYDPFSGRGTTIIEASLRKRRGIANDINPLSKILAQPRLQIPQLGEVEKRLAEIKIKSNIDSEMDLSMFYEKNTLREILSLREYLRQKERKGTADHIDNWIRMIGTNRLTGHSINFFSVYTLPPNQATSAANQKKINVQRKQKPAYKNVKAIILKKSKDLIASIPGETRTSLAKYGSQALFFNTGAGETNEIKSNLVQLTVTSPPFLDIVQYASDNWLRCWFNHINAEEVTKKITMSRNVEQWSEVMGKVFSQLYRITKPGGWVAFEVGEVRNGKIKLDEYVVPLGVHVGFSCAGILINEQQFTKTANIWGVSNNAKGTNSNRIVVFQKATSAQ